jgi:hypothetical protein
VIGKSQVCDQLHWDESILQFSGWGFLLMDDRPSWCGVVE